jgi:hypothetical protein
MVLSTARMLDNTRSKQNGRPQEAQRNISQNSIVANQNQGRNQKVLTKYTGPNMGMQSGVRLSHSDWAKLTKELKSKIYDFNMQRQGAACAPNSVMVNNTNVVESKPIEIFLLLISNLPIGTLDTSCQTPHLVTLHLLKLSHTYTQFLLLCIQN